MEPSTIFLMACLFILLFLVYFSYSSSPSTLLSSATLANVATTIKPPAPATGALKPSFTFAIWININDWSTANGFVKNIISYGTSAYISLDQINNDVIVAVKTSTTSPIYTINTTIHNVPLQTWTHLAFCLNGITLDSYLNGKLVNTSLLTHPYIPAGTGDSIILGGVAPPTSACSGTTVGNVAGGIINGCYHALTSGANPGFNGWLTQFNYFQDAQEPQAIWDLYKAGNGTGGLFGNMFGSYGLTVALTNNGTTTNSISV